MVVVEVIAWSTTADQVLGCHQWHLPIFFYLRHGTAPSLIQLELEVPTATLRLRLGVTKHILQLKSSDLFVPSQHVSQPTVGLLCILS